MLKPRLMTAILLALIFALNLAAQTTEAPAPKTTGKRPVIIIPGITGSQLTNTRTGKNVWFSAKRDKDDDLRLPMTSPVLTRDRDNLQPGDIIREVKLPVLPDVQVYQTLIDALIERGYTEADWKHPKATDVFYVFSYDWRRDNVETAQLLMQKILAVKRELKNPGLKFDILAHSMGGLVARYAAMYGTADLPREGVAPVPTWMGAASINKLMMFGTPNEGAFTSFDALLNGYPIIADRKLPFIDDLRAEDVLTCPSAFQLIPHGRYARFLDENLQPINVDIYDPANWVKYGWGAIGDPKFLGKLKDGDKSALKDKEVKALEKPERLDYDDLIVANTTTAQVKAYFASALSRAKRFHMALDASSKTMPIQLYAYGSKCQPTLDAVVLVRDEKKERWLTIVEPRDIKTADGKEIKKDDVKAAMVSEGDGRVTVRSLLSEIDLQKPGDKNPVKGMFTLTSSFFGCSTHIKLFLDKPIQDSFLSALIVEKQGQP